jgi:hypothetical protein
MSTGHQGQVAGKDPDTEIRYAYDETLEMVMDVSPLMGGWAPSNDSIAYAAGPPDYVTGATGGGATMTARYPLRFEQNNTDDPAAGTVFTLTGIRIDYYRDALSSCDIIINELAEDGSASANALEQYGAPQFGVTTPAWTTYTDTFSHAIDVKNKGYFLVMSLTPNGAATARFGTIRLTYTKTAVE